MANLSDRIKSLRMSANMTQEEFGKKFGIVKSTVSLYESGKSTPNDQIKKQICDYFHVSLDYLLGLTNESSFHSELNKNASENHSGFFFFFFDDSLKNIFVERFKNSLAKKELSIKEFSQIASLDFQKCEAYFHGESEPTLEDLVEISKILDISIDYLLGRTPKITSTERKILNAFVKLDEDNQDILIGKAKELLREQRHDESVAADDSLKKTGTTNSAK